MESPQTKLGVIAKAWRWVMAFAAMPERIRILAEAAVQDRDGRIRCPNCIDSRIGEVRAYKVQGGSGGDIGRCQTCHVVFWLDLPNRHAKAIVREPPQF